MDDREIVTAILAGDPAGPAGAYDTYAVPLYGYCRWMLPDLADAAGALQCTFVTAVTRLRGLRDPRKLRPWLYAVTRRECRRRLRAAALAPAAEAADAAHAAEAAQAAEAADGGRGAGQAELRRLIRAILDGLGPADREVIELSLVHHLDDSDLAVVLGMPRIRAHARAARARGRLENALGMLLIARTGRKACPALDELLAGWDGRPTSQTRGLVGEHLERCPACAGRRRGALRPQALAGLLPLAAPPPGLREVVLRLCAGLPRDALRYRRQRTWHAEPPRPARVPRGVRVPRAARVPRAGRTAARDGIRGNPEAAVGAAAVVMWVAAAVSVTVIAFASSHPASAASAATARTSSGPPAVAHPCRQFGVSPRLRVTNPEREGGRGCR